MIVFKYRQEKNGIFGNSIKRPVAEIKLKGKNGWITLNPYIDSGADTTLIPFSIGEFLGLTYKENEVTKIAGVAGFTKAVRKKVKASIGEKEFSLTLTWAMTENVPALLGRKDVFDNFKITFNQKEEEVIFE